MIKKVLSVSYVFLLGLIFIIALLEIILFACGYLSSKKIGDVEITKKERDKYRVICLGDSFTYGLGAEKGSSYVDYLRFLLQDKVGSNNIEVINCGDPGTNTSQPINWFIDHVDGSYIDIVVFLSGCQNFYNVKEIKPFIESKKTYNNFFVQPIVKLKFFKLMRLLYDKIKLKYYFQVNSAYSTEGGDCSGAEVDKDYNSNFLNLGDDYFNKRLYDKAKYLYKKEIKYNPNSISGYMRLLDVMIQLHEWKDVLNYTDEAINLGCKEGKLYSMLAKSLESLGRLEEAKVNYMIALELGCDIDDIYKRLAFIFKNLGQKNEALSFFKNEIYRNKEAASYVFMFENIHKSDFIKEWVYFDLLRLKNACKNNNVALILQNYPMIPCNDDLEISMIIQDFADKYNCLFVDQYNYFKDKAPKKKYFFLDHCNSYGYKIMAKNIFDKIIENNLVDY